MELIAYSFFLCFQIAALGAAIWYWRAYNYTTQQYFLWFLIYVVVHELTGLACQHFFKVSNVILHNVYTLISFLFYFFWFSKILQKRRFFIPVLLSVFLVFFVYDFFDADPFYDLYLNPIIVGAFSILSLTLSYFVEILNEDAITHFTKSQKFWIVTGLFSFYIGLIPMLIFHNYLNYGGDFYGIVITVLNAVLYGCIFKSFLCLKKNP